MEACSSSHYRARELTKLGHDLRLIPAMYVKPYVKRGKSDAIDAEAICEAVTRPTMRFATIKSGAQQAVPFLHHAQDLIIRQRTQLSNMLRGLLAEFGITLARGGGHAIKFAKSVADGTQPDLHEAAQDVVVNLSHQLVALHLGVGWYDRRIALETRNDPRVYLLRTSPGIGPVTASAIVATAGSAKQFRNGREFAAWLGLIPLNRSGGGKERLGRNSKMGDRYVRRLLVAGMTARVVQMKRKPERADPWAEDLLARKPFRPVTVAMATKAARIAWALLTKNERYQSRAV